MEQDVLSDSEVDIFGLTHSGLKRKENQDQFLVASLHKKMKMRETSLSPIDEARLLGPPVGYLMVVADGVGGQSAGGEASSAALKTLVEYATQSMRCYDALSPQEEQDFLRDLHEGVMQCHTKVTEDAGRDPEHTGMATTMTLAAVVWPYAYIIQVGDSRCYLLHDNKLTQLTRDQTVAQDLLDSGVMKPEEVDAGNWGHVLSSAIGGPEAAPVATRVRLTRADTMVLCSDGLTKHVTDDRITEILLEGLTAEETCRKLVDGALDGGGTDNITVVVGRSRQDN